MCVCVCRMQKVITFSKELRGNVLCCNPNCTFVMDHFGLGLDTYDRADVETVLDVCLYESRKQNFLHKWAIFRVSHTKLCCT